MRPAEVGSGHDDGDGSGGGSVDVGSTLARDNDDHRGDIDDGGGCARHSKPI
jgi:hypothetical protein